MFENQKLCFLIKTILKRAQDNSKNHHNLASYTDFGFFHLGRDQQLIGAHNTIVFSLDGAEVYFRNDDKEAARFVLISGRSGSK